MDNNIAMSEFIKCIKIFMLSFMLMYFTYNHES